MSHNRGKFLRNASGSSLFFVVAAVPVWVNRTDVLLHQELKALMEAHEPFHPTTAPGTIRVSSRSHPHRAGTITPRSIPPGERAGEL
jgi:hypothetical protein